MRWLDLHELEKVYGAPKHTTRVETTASNHHCESRLSRIKCGSSFADRPTAQNRVVNSRIKRHLQKRSQSHDLVTRRGHTANQLQSFRAGVLVACKRTAHTSA